MLALNGDTLLSRIISFYILFYKKNNCNLVSINIFIDKLQTLTNKTMEDTLSTIKIYENARFVLIDFLFEMIFY